MPDFRDYYPYHRDLEDGRTLVVVPLTFGRARLAFGDEWGITGEHW